MAKRLFDIIISSLLLIFLAPFLILIAIAVGVTSPGGVFYKQKRVGKGGAEFLMWKFRTMAPGSDKKGLLTVGANDARITKIGYYLRKLKLDELPQLFNVLAGDMSLVGPRPEVKKYTDLYNTRQRKVLNVRPGITDWASIEFSNENEILAQYPDPEKAYINEVMPQKLELNLKYIQQQSLKTDFIIIWKTARKVFFK